MKRLLALLAASTLAATAMLAGSTSSATATPVPENDPFYAVPATIASYADGAVIASRKVTAIAYLLPIPADAWQILYRTNDAHGAPTATVTTLMVPRTAWKGAGTRPLVSYQTAEDGVAGKCAPSYGLRGGLLGTRNASDAESGLMVSALSNGWAVAAPDYEGPDSQFLAGRMEGQAVLDGLRAAVSFSPAGLSAGTRLGIWGYSGGAFASSIASQLQATYAPELNVAGVALGGVVGDIRKTIDDFSGSAVGGAIAMGVNGPLKAFPEYDLGQYLSTAGRAKVAAASGDCIADAVARYPFLSIKQIEAFPGALDSPVVAGLLHANSPLGIPGTPTAPVYDYHARYDELAPVGPDRELMRRYCDSGQSVEHVEHLLAEHISETVSGAPGALEFFSQRFAGIAPKDTCASLPAA
ncbi:MAG: lipase family protein [Marmoricola sp.]